MLRNIVGFAYDWLKIVYTVAVSPFIPFSSVSSSLSLRFVQGTSLMSTSYAKFTAKSKDYESVLMGDPLISSPSL